MNAMPLLHVMPVKRPLPFKPRYGMLAQLTECMYICKVEIFKMILVFRLDKNIRRRLLYRSFGLVYRTTCQQVVRTTKFVRRLQIRDIMALEIVSRLPRLGE